MTVKCQWSPFCKNRASHKILTKHGDFKICRTHVKEAEKNKDVRYIVPLKKKK